MEESMDKEPAKGRLFCLPCLWLDGLASLSKSSRKLAIGGLILAPVVWWADAAVDHFVFGAGVSFAESLLYPTPMEVWVRVMAGLMFIVFGTYAAFLLDRAERTEHELRASNHQLERLKDELEQLVVVDPLTGVFNRRKFHEHLGMTLSAAIRHKHPFVLLMFDIDHFKQINDRFGHHVGDTVLRTLCEVISASIRDSDLLFRVGGEEFCLVATSLEAEQARSLGEKMRRMVESYRFPGVGKVTISIGIAAFREGDSQQHLYARADSALYAAKRRGRNRVMCADKF